MSMRLYLVDYENVSDAGLVGVDQLSGNDIVVIFYGSKVKSVAYESLIAITSSSANIEHVKAEKGYSIKRQESIVIKEKVVEEISEEQPKARPRRTYTRRAGNSGRTTTRTGRQKVVTKSQPKKPRTTTRPTVSDKQKAEIRAALKGAELSAPDYKKVYDAFASCENASAYNNKLQKSLGNDKTSVVYKETRMDESCSV